MASDLDFMLAIGRLKVEKRTGWVRKGIHLPESIGDHMHRMALLSMILPHDLGIDTRRCTRISLVHDLAECIVGDITPYCGVSKQEKHQRELDAMTTLTAKLPGAIGEEIFALWKEYEDMSKPLFNIRQAETSEAKLVKDLDKFEMILQAFEYEKAEGKIGYLQEFFDSVEGKIKHQHVIGWATELRAKRAALLSGQ